jgi:hypothetical protein
MRLEDLRLENLRLEDLRLENLRLEDLRLEDLRLEDLRLEDSHRSRKSQDLYVICTYKLFNLVSCVHHNNWNFSKLC